MSRSLPFAVHFYHLIINVLVTLATAKDPDHLHFLQHFFQYIEMARYLALGVLALSGIALGDDGCHFNGQFPRERSQTTCANHSTHPDDSIGRYCAFSNYDTYLDAAALYCYQFRSPFHVPKGDSQSNI